jgi:glycosyltransferase
MKKNKDLSIILPSFNDARIGRAISSIRNFDDEHLVKIIVVDGGSKKNVLNLIKKSLTADDVLLSEPDKGIFDALNKGLDLTTTKYIGWIGSDDLFTGRIKASDVIAALKKNELFIAKLAMFRDGRITRMTSAFPSKLRLTNLGFHNPHFATFGRSSLLKSRRFDLELKAADIEYFLRLFELHPSIEVTNKISTIQSEGGFSTRSIQQILKLNYECISIYSKKSGLVLGIFASFLKLAAKIPSRTLYYLWNKKAQNLIVKNKGLSIKI